MHHPAINLLREAHTHVGKGHPATILTATGVEPAVLVALRITDKAARHALFHEDHEVRVIALVRCAIRSQRDLLALLRDEPQ